MRRRRQPLRPSAVLLPQAFENAAEGRGQPVRPQAAIQYRFTTGRQQLCPAVGVFGIHHQHHGRCRAGMTQSPQGLNIRKRRGRQQLFADHQQVATLPLQHCPIHLFTVEKVDRRVQPPRRLRQGRGQHRLSYPQCNTHQNHNLRPPSCAKPCPTPFSLKIYPASEKKSASAFSAYHFLSGAEQDTA